MQSQSKVLGPFEVIQEIGAIGRVLVTLPYKDVRGSQILVAVTDNFAKLAVGSSDNQFWAAAEVEVLGSIQGYEHTLKRQYCRSITGPMLFVVPDEQAMDKVIFRARNLTGGRRGPPGVSGASDPSAANGFSITVTIHVQPRGGMGPASRFSEGMG